MSKSTSLVFVMLSSQLPVNFLFRHGRQKQGLKLLIIDARWVFVANEANKETSWD